MSTNVTLQLAGKNDAEAISRLSRSLIERGLPWTWTPERVSGHIRRRDSTVLIAKANGNLVGFAMMQFDDDTAHLNLLAVVPGFRRQGVASQLLTWLHQAALVAGTFTIHVEMRADNTPARRFYLSMGYQEIGYERGYYDDVEDAVKMTRELGVVSPDSSDPLVPPSAQSKPR
jgi:ribosomal-protein-alanine N-acetyltransferase